MHDTPFRLTADQRNQFLTDGLVRVSGVIPSDIIDALANTVWKTLTLQIGAVRDRPETWTHAPEQFRDIARASAFTGMLSSGVRNLLDDFFGERGWQEPTLLPRPLSVSFPTGRPMWTLPTLHWHLDGVEPELWPDRVRVFVLLAPVEPRGGGTAYVSGSHRAVIRAMSEMSVDNEPIRSKTVIKRLKRESPWIADLCSRGDDREVSRVVRFMREGAEFRDVRLRVAEMTGDLGDVIFWHPNLLHTFTSNCGSTPRLVLSVTIVKR
jgi:Phytanoyl-CoA dioxygenase (PhyH)